MTYLPLHPCSALKDLREILSDTIPVAHAAFDTSDAVVIWVTELVHRRSLDAHVGAHLVTVLFGETSLDERKEVVCFDHRLREPLSSGLFRHVIAPDVSEPSVVMLALPALSHPLLQPERAGSASWPVDVAIGQHVIHSSEVHALQHSHLREMWPCIHEKAQSIRMLVGHMDVDGLIDLSK